jgi:hypothetical protein
MNFCLSRLRRCICFVAFLDHISEDMPCETRRAYTPSRSAFMINFIMKRSLRITPIILIAVTAFAHADSTMVAGFNEIKSFGGSRVSFVNYRIPASDTQAMIYIDYNYWLYNLNDTLFMDSGALVLSAIDTANKTITYTVLPAVQNADRVKKKVGVFEDICFTDRLWTLRLDSTRSNSTVITLFVLPAMKHYVYDNDTVLLSRDTMTFLHVFDEGNSIVNCRNLLLTQSIPVSDHYGIFGRVQCFGDNYVSFLGRLEGAALNLEIGGIHELLFLAEAHDSITRAISIGETWQVPGTNQTFSLEWTAPCTYNGYAGFRVASALKTTRPPSIDRIKSNNAPFTSRACDILGRRLPLHGKNIERGLILKKTRDGVDLILGSVRF